MSWNLHFIGRPDAVRRSLRTFANGVPAIDRDRFKSVQHALDQLVALNSDGEVSLSASSDNESIQIVLMRSNALHVE